MTYEEFIEKLKAARIELQERPEYNKDKYSYRTLHTGKGYYISCSWITGGMTGGNCWGDEANIPVTPELEPELTELDTLFSFICPYLTFLQYKNICSNVIHIIDSNGCYEYYGNYTMGKEKYVYMQELYDKLKQEGLIT